MDESTLLVQTHIFARIPNWLITRLWHAFGESSSVRENKSFGQSSQREGCSSNMASLERILELMGLKTRKRWNLGATLSLLSRGLKLTPPHCVPQEVLLVMRSGQRACKTR
jgi:hypothetical protein